MNEINHKKKLETIRIYLTAEFKARVQAEADRQGITVSSLLKVILFDYFYLKNKTDGIKP